MMSISIMAHPKRKEWVEELQAQLGGVVPVSYDTGFGIIENCKRAWESHNRHARYHLVLQDDAILCRDFRKRAEAVIGHVMASSGGLPISFYAGSRPYLLPRLRKAEKTKVMFGPLWWGVAVCLPVCHVRPMLRLYSSLSAAQDDSRIRHYLSRVGLKVWYPIPSLVNHRKGKSLVGDPGEARVAYKFIDK